MTAQFLTSELTSLVQDSKRKNPELRNVRPTAAGSKWYLELTDRGVGGGKVASRLEITFHHI
jgi:hypothetical protein